MFSFAKADSNPAPALDEAKAAAYTEEASASKTILQVSWFDSPEIMAAIPKDDAVVG